MKNKLTAIILSALLGVIIGCTTTRVIEEPPGSGNFKKVAETDPRFTQGLESAKGVSDVFAPINPWHGLVTLALGTAAALAEWNKRRKQAQLDAVITGVESSGNESVKKSINNAAMAAKVETALNKSVKAVTG